jgi:tetratricopeptide (TPR) repeat protein
MSAIAELTRAADERLRAQVNVVTKLAASAVAGRLDGPAGPHDAAVAARRVLAELASALDTAQLRVQELDDAVAHFAHVLPFLEEGWPRQQALLTRAIDENPLDGLASWLNYWFAAASTHRVDALRRLLADVPLPGGADILAERIAEATDGLAENDWARCYEIVLTGADGLRVGLREIPDQPVPKEGEGGPGQFEPSQPVRENLRLLAVRIALHDQLPDQADAVLRKDCLDRDSAARLALRSRLARSRGQADAANSLFKRARDKNPRDMDAVMESMLRVRERGEPGRALQYARDAVSELLSLGDVEGDISRLIDPPAELWIALAERAEDNAEHDRALYFLDRADESTPDDAELAAAIAEQRAYIFGQRRGDMKAPSPEARRALVSAGQWRTIADQLELARRDYETAAGLPLAGDEDVRVQAAAWLRLADVLATIARQRSASAAESDLFEALSLLEKARQQEGADGNEPWSYLTETALHIQLSKKRGADGRCKHEWQALRAAARAVLLMPGRARAWQALAAAAMTMDLYLVASAAAERARILSNDEATRAGYARALLNIGRYEDALGQLGVPDGARRPGGSWEQCVRGVIALRQHKEEDAVRHFASVTIDPAWTWAWHSFICALASIGDLAAARRKSEDFMRAFADREGERSWLYAAAFDACLHGRLDDAREYALRLFKTAGAEDPKALYAEGMALVLSRETAGWKQLARAISRDPRPTSIDVWAREDRPALAALAAEHGFTLESLNPPPEITDPHVPAHPGDPVTELRAAAKLSDLWVAAEAASLAEAALLTPSEAASRNPESRGTTKLADDRPGGASYEPTLRLRLPASWFERNAAPGYEDTVGLRYAPELPGLLARDGAEVDLSGSDDLEPDGYQIFADARLRVSGHVDPERRYCSRETLPLLPGPVLANQHVVTDHGYGIPRNLLSGDDAPGEHRKLARLLTRSAAEVIAAQHAEAAGGTCGPQSPAYPQLTMDWLASQFWKLRENPPWSDDDNWRGAEQLLEQITQDAAYFRWINRGRPFGSPLTDWSAAERDMAGSGTGQGPLPAPVVRRLVRHELDKQFAYFRWEERGRPFGDPMADWPA